MKQKVAPEKLGELMNGVPLLKTKQIARHSNKVHKRLTTLSTGLQLRKTKDDYTQ